MPLTKALSLAADQPARVTQATNSPTATRFSAGSNHPKAKKAGKDPNTVKSRLAELPHKKDPDQGRGLLVFVRQENQTPTPRRMMFRAPPALNHWI